ncbi:MAG: hypothetical protein K0Q46_3991 [Rhodococcus erythropolis]|nr:hypothetical protein [Rhodococcus erythropolis]MCD2156320.1 hypothetical protein [Rhodococcus cerastii]MDF2897205.1 hypothetical protein [Rhodococcus erythropolis]
MTIEILAVVTLMTASNSEYTSLPRPGVNDRLDAPETIERDDTPRGDPEELTVTARRIEDEVSAACGSASATAAIMREGLADCSAQRVRDVVRR